MFFIQIKDTKTATLSWSNGLLSHVSILERPPQLTLEFKKVNGVCVGKYSCSTRDTESMLNIEPVII